MKTTYIKSKVQKQLHNPLADDGEYVPVWSNWRSQQIEMLTPRILYFRGGGFAISVSHDSTDLVYLKKHCQFTRGISSTYRMQKSEYNRLLSKYNQINHII